MPSLNMSLEAEWYTDKGRVAQFVGAESESEVSDYSMDAAYKWVNGQLARKRIDATQPTVKTDLDEDPNITMAMTWYVCFLEINTIRGNQEPARIRPDGRQTSIALGQGNVSLGFAPSEISEHYDELTTPDFSMLAQRAMRDFFASQTDKFRQPVQFIMSVSNAYEKYDVNPDYANRLYTRRRIWR